MHPRISHTLRLSARWMLIGPAGVAGALLLASGSASAATTGSFSNGVLTVFGDANNNTITISRDAAGTILVNGGAVTVLGGKATVANTSLIQVFGQSGNDTIRLDEANGALPRANLFGGTGNDRLTGGSGADLLFGQAGNDTADGKGGSDFLFGGAENDRLTGGDADDQMFGEGGDDLMVWSPGDDTDLNEGGTGTDTVEVNGGNGAESFTTTANGTRVRFDRLDPAPFAIDIGTSENLVLNANGGNDRFSNTGNLATLIKITADGGTGDDTLLGSNGVDVLNGGDGNDVIDGQQGNDTLFGANGNDTIQWDPGDGSDIVEGQAGTDTMLFNGSAANERMEASANGGRLRFTRDIGNIVMDTDDVEIVDVNALAGIDTVTVGDLAGTDVVELDANLAGTIGGTTGDAQADTVVVNGTSADDVVFVDGDGVRASVSGLSAQVNVTGAEVANDHLTVNALAGDDVVAASGLPAGTVQLVEQGGDGNDVLLGSPGNDTLLGEAGDDVLIGGGGIDVLDGGPGDNVVISFVAAASRSLSAADPGQVTAANVADATWITDHVQVIDGRTAITIDGKITTVDIDMSALVAQAAAEEPPATDSQATTPEPTTPAADPDAAPTTIPASEPTTMPIAAESTETAVPAPVVPAS